MKKKIKPIYFGPPPLRQQAQHIAKLIVEADSIGFEREERGLTCDPNSDMRSLYQRIGKLIVECENAPPMLRWLATELDLRRA